MKAINLIATALNIRDDKPNQDLAIEIIRSERHDWIKELVDNLHHTNKNVQSDCIKVLYEIGERGHADMIAPYVKEFENILRSTNNRMVWGAMIALGAIAVICPKEVYDLLPEIIRALENGSVITVDHGIGILAQLSSTADYRDVTFPLLMEQLLKCPAKQFPMYAEKSMIAINALNKKPFLDLLQSRISEIDKDSKKRRIKKVIEQVNKKLI